MGKDIYGQIEILNEQKPLICTFYEDEKVRTVCIDIEKTEQIGVCFEKDYVIVRTKDDVKFVCKGKAFISLWR